MPVRSESTPPSTSTTSTSGMTSASQRAADMNTVRATIRTPPASREHLYCGCSTPTITALARDGVAMSGEPVVRVRGLRMSYGTHEVLAGVDLDVHPGEVVCLLGPNGAG